MLSHLLDRSPISSMSDCRPVVSLRVNYGTWTETIVLYNDAAYTSVRVGESAKPSSVHIPQRFTSTTTIRIRPCLGLVHFKSAQPCGNGRACGQHAANGAGMGWRRGKGYIVRGGLSRVIL